MNTLPQLHNGQALPLQDIPEFAIPDFRNLILERVRRGRRISSLCGMPDGAGNRGAVGHRAGRTSVAQAHPVPCLLCTRPGCLEPG
jgi:hypothetical protein